MEWPVLLKMIEEIENRPAVGESHRGETSGLGPFLCGSPYVFEAEANAREGGTETVALLCTLLVAGDEVRERGVGEPGIFHAKDRAPRRLRGGV